MLGIQHLQTENTQQDIQKTGQTIIPVLYIHNMIEFLKSSQDQITRTRRKEIQDNFPANAIVLVLSNTKA